MLQDESYSYQDIINKTGISLTHIYNINTGKRRARSELNYPIRPSNTKGTKGLKFSPDECVVIHNKILNQDQTFKEIAEEFNCSVRVITDINNGKTKAYRLEGFTYPLRNAQQAKSLSKTLYWINK